MAVITKKTAFIGLVVVAGVLTLWKFLWKSNETKETVTPVPTTSTQTTSGTTGVVTQGTTPTVPAVGEKNVSVRTSYKNPGGSDEVGFVLTVDKNGVITDAITEVLAIHDISKMRQSAFAAALPAAIKGKKLSELTSIDRVGGSSLTTAAFNASLSQLKAEL